MAALIVLIVIYLRVSTEEQARKGYSLPEQREACRRKADALSSELEASGARVEMREFVDTFGGDIVERPVLEEMRLYIKEARPAPAWFVCMDPDRFSRNLTMQLLITDEIESVGTKLAFVQHNYEKTPEGKLFYQLRGAVSEFEKAKILERTARGKRGKLKAGKRTNGVSPYGYRHNKETDELEILEPEARWVREIFHWFVHDRVPYFEIAERLRKLGVPAKKGGVWCGGTVSYLINNPTYVGSQICNKHDTIGKSSRRRLPREKREAMTARIRPAEEWVPVPVPAIIDRALFDQAQQLASIIVRRGGPRDHHLLSMLLKCGHCGSSMSYVTGNRYGYVRCSRTYADLREYRDQTRCPNRNHRTDKIEGEVWATICAWMTKPELMELYLEEQKVAGPTAFEASEHLAAEISALEQRLAEEQAKQDVIIEKQMKGLLTEAAADRMLATSTGHAATLESSLADARQRYRQLQTSLASIQEAVQRFRSMAEAIKKEQAEAQMYLDQLDQQGRRQLVKLLVKQVIIQKDGSWSIVPY